MGTIISRVNYVQNKPDKPLYVTFTTAGTTFNQYGEALSVAGLASAAIISYTVPINKTFAALVAEVSGTNRAEFIVEVNASTEAKRRTYFTEYNARFELSGMKLVAGDIIKIIVDNKTNSTADFNANIIGIIDDA